MRIKYLIPAALTAAALAMAACTGPSTPRSINTNRLDGDEKSVVSVWHRNSSSAERDRIEKLSADDVKAAVIAFALLCLVTEEEGAAFLMEGPNQMSKDGAEKLADAIDDRLCDPRHKPRPRTSTSSPAPKDTPSKAPSPQDRSYTNPSHDLTKPTSRHDREDALQKTGQNKEPARTHTDTGAAPKAAAPAPRPAAPPRRTPAGHR